MRGAAPNGVGSRALSAASCCKLRVLFVDDEPLIRQIMATELPDRGHDVTVCEDGASALKVLAEKSFDCAILDLQMPGLSGWEVATRMKEIAPDTLAIIHTAHGSMDTAIQALRMRVFDFLPKPCSLFDLDSLLLRVAEHRTLMNKTIALEKSLKAVQGNSDLVGESAPMQRVKRLIDKIAPTDSSVLILGETGTGKELVARRIHDLSSRASMPFVAVNCGALPEQLVESEFFGHRKGAFTGAEISRKGLLEVADGGTLFLDEIGDMSLKAQATILRALQENKISRVGSDKDIKVDVRIISATNKNLREEISRGRFREDLYNRLEVIDIYVPSLNERKDDIPVLVDYFLKTISAEYGFKTEKKFAIDAIFALQNINWSGNIRQLRNVVERLLIYCRDKEVITEEDIEKHIHASRGQHRYEDLFNKYETLEDLLRYVASEYKKYQSVKA